MQIYSDNGIFMIDFFLVFSDNTKSKEKRIKVKNSSSEIQAKIKLEDYCKKKYKCKTIIITQCLDYTFMDNMSN